MTSYTSACALYTPSDRDHHSITRPQTRWISHLFALTNGWNLAEIYLVLGFLLWNTLVYYIVSTQKCFWKNSGEFGHNFDDFSFTSPIFTHHHVLPCHDGWCLHDPVSLQGQIYSSYFHGNQWEWSDSGDQGKFWRPLTLVNWLTYLGV